MMLTGCFFGGGSTASSYTPSIYGQWKFSDGRVFEITRSGFYRDFAQTKGMWVINSKDNFSIVSGSQYGGTYRIGSDRYDFSYSGGQWYIRNQRSGSTVYATKNYSEITPVGLVGRWRCTDGVGAWTETYSADHLYQMISTEVTNPTIDSYTIIAGDLNNGVFELYDSQFEFDVTGLTLTIKRLDDDYAWTGTFVY